MKHITITPSDIQSLQARYSYDKETGELTCLARTGKGTGNTRGAYLVKSPLIPLSDGRKIRTGRAVYAIATGTDVQDREIVRHIDGDVLNRKWSNLQVARYSDIEKATPVKQLLVPHLDFLRECFEYNPETGYLIWKTRPLHHFKNAASHKTFNKRRAGKRAGTMQGKDKRLQVHIISGGLDLHPYTAAIIWAMVHGEDVPEGLVIDHRNRNTSDERLSNLRLATYAGNTQNSKRDDTIQGMRGIYKASGKYSVRFVNTPQNYQFSRSFVSLEDARNCRKALEHRFHGEFAFEPTAWTPELQKWIDRLDSLNRANTRTSRI
jgi:hypothetical protein